MAEELPPIAGYVRAGPTHIGAHWSFEVMSEATRVGLVEIETADGSVFVGLNRRDAERLLRQLQLFLADFPSDQTPS